MPADQPHRPPHHHRSFIGGLRASFLTGLVVILPISLTIYFIWSAIGWIDSWVLPFLPQPWQPGALIDRFLGPDTGLTPRGLGVIVFLAFTVAVGWVAKGLIGRSLIHWAERVVDRMPVVRSIYNGLKQIAETVFSTSSNNFERACMVEFPRPGIWAIGFVATHAKGEIAGKLPGDDRIITVFVPTTPNPTSGFLIYVPESQITYLDMKIEDAAKLIISAGLVYPSDKGGPSEKGGPPVPPETAPAPQP